MSGINLNLPISFKFASLRVFQGGERHVNRFATDNILLMVYDGVLRFSEDGAIQQVRAGEYYIQKKNCEQRGTLPCDAPSYLYVHFDGEWDESAAQLLPRRGFFSTDSLHELMMKLGAASNQGLSLCEQQYLFLKLLLSLRKNNTGLSVAHKISSFIDENIATVSSLSEICLHFHYSKNYIIRIFKKEFGKTPFEYINDVKIKRAMYLLETTSRPIEEISAECGYRNYSYFYKVFVKKTGTSPIKWRSDTHSHVPFE